MKYKTGLFIWSPLVLAITSAHYKSLWLIPATVLLMFIMVAVLPFARKRESLWLFLLCAVCSIPINLFLLNEYPLWREYIFCGEKGILNILSLFEMTLICTSVEEVVIALVGRKIWKRQYALMLPELEE